MVVCWIIWSFQLRKKLRPPVECWIRLINFNFSILHYCEWLNFRGNQFFVVFVKGSFHEFKYPRNNNFLYDFWRKIKWPRILNNTNELFSLNRQKLVPTKIKPSVLFLFTFTITYKCSFGFILNTVYKVYTVYHQIQYIILIITIIKRISSR